MTVIMMAMIIMMHDDDDAMATCHSQTAAVYNILRGFWG
jgi:hypothetical protein